MKSSTVICNEIFSALYIELTYHAHIFLFIFTNSFDINIVLHKQPRKCVIKCVIWLQIISVIKIFNLDIWCRLNDLGDSVEQSQHKQYIKHMKQELTSLLRQSMTFKTFSGKYPTKTGKLLIPEQPSKYDINQIIKTILQWHNN